jgi:hypothetical protein
MLPAFVFTHFYMQGSGFGGVLVSRRKALFNPGKTDCQGWFGASAAFQSACAGKIFSATIFLKIPIV